jgi:hypothetical protein
MARTRSTPGGGLASEQALKELERAFASFRRKRSGRWRIPQALRNRVVAAVDAGVPASSVGQRFGVTGKQLSRWRAERGGADGRAADVWEAAAPTILRVVEREEVAEPDAIELELGLGEWRVAVRLQPQRRAVGR